MHWERFASPIKYYALALYNENIATTACSRHRYGKYLQSAHFIQFYTLYMCTFFYTKTRKILASTTLNKIALKYISMPYLNKKKFKRFDQLKFAYERIDFGAQIGIGTLMCGTHPPALRRSLMQRKCSCVCAVMLNKCTILHIIWILNNKYARGFTSEWTHTPHYIYTSTIMMRI